MNPVKMFFAQHNEFLNLSFFGLNFVISDFVLSVVFAPLLCGLLMVFAIRKISYQSLGLQAIVEIIYETLYNDFYETLGEKSEKYVPFVISLFLFIFILNMFNLLEVFFSCTSQLGLTLALSFLVMFLIVSIGFYKAGVNFWRFFVPSGLPVILRPLLFILELLTFLIRPFSLALRLSISIVAGHIMIHIIAGLSQGPVSKIFIIAILSILSIFEMGIAVLQAYVFSMLSCVYIAEILEFKIKKEGE